MSSKCMICRNNNKESNYDFCKECITKHVRVCTCEKKFITGKPSIVDIGNSDILHRLEIPEPIPEYFLTQLKGNIYHIIGCRGCKNAGKEISVQDNFEQALQASIVSCVYQKVEENGNTFYEYLSDALDPVFEEYLDKNGIKIGEPAEIRVE